MTRGGRWLRTLKICTRWNWFVRFTPRPLYLHAKKPQRPLNMRFGRRRRWCARFWWREIPLSPPPTPPHHHHHRHHHHHAFKDWGLVARSSLNISLCNGSTVFVFPPGWSFPQPAAGSVSAQSTNTLYPPAVTAAELYQKLLVLQVLSKWLTIWNKLHLFAFIIQVLFCSWWRLQSTQWRWRIATVMGANGATLTSSCVAMKLV